MTAVMLKIERVGVGGHVSANDVEKRTQSLSDGLGIEFLLQNRDVRPRDIDGILKPRSALTYLCRFDVLCNLANCSCLKNEAFLLNTQDFVFAHTGRDAKLIFPQSILELRFFAEERSEAHLEAGVLSLDSLQLLAKVTKDLSGNYRLDF